MTLTPGWVGFKKPREKEKKKRLEVPVVPSCPAFLRPPAPNFATGSNSLPALNRLPQAIIINNVRWRAHPCAFFRTALSIQEIHVSGQVKPFLSQGLKFVTGDPNGRNSFALGVMKRTGEHPRKHALKQPPVLAAETQQFLSKGRLSFGKEEKHSLPLAG